MRPVALLALVLAASSCAPPAPTASVPKPIPGVSGYTSERYVFYRRDQQPQNRIAVVEIRPMGIDRAPRNGRLATRVHIAVEMQNLGSQRVDLDVRSVKLDAAALSNRTFRSLRPAQVVGSAIAPPHEQRRVDLFFAMPDDVAPKDVAGLRLTWMVQAGIDEYMTTTPLAQTFDPDTNAVSLYAVPGSYPLLLPVERRVVLPRPEAYRKSIVF